MSAHIRVPNLQMSNALFRQFLSSGLHNKHSIVVDPSKALDTMQFGQAVPTRPVDAIKVEFAGESVYAFRNEMNNYYEWDAYSEDMLLECEPTDRISYEGLELQMAMLNKLRVKLDRNASSVREARGFSSPTKDKARAEELKKFLGIQGDSTLEHLLSELSVDEVKESVNALKSIIFEVAGNTNGSIADISPGFDAKQILNKEGSRGKVVFREFERSLLSSQLGCSIDVSKSAAGIQLDLKDGSGRPFYRLRAKETIRSLNEIRSDLGDILITSAYDQPARLVTPESDLTFMSVIKDDFVKNNIEEFFRKTLNVIVVESPSHSNDSFESFSKEVKGVPVTSIEALESFLLAAISKERTNNNAFFMAMEKGKEFHSGKSLSDNRSYEDKGLTP